MSTNSNTLSLKLDNCVKNADTCAFNDVYSARNERICAKVLAPNPQPELYSFGRWLVNENEIEKEKKSK